MSGMLDLGTFSTITWREGRERQTKRERERERKGERERERERGRKNMLRHSLSKHTHDMFTSTHYKYYMISHTHIPLSSKDLRRAWGIRLHTHTHTHTHNWQAHSHQLIAYTKLITRSVQLCIYRPLDDLYSILKGEAATPLYKTQPKDRQRPYSAIQVYSPFQS